MVLSSQKDGFGDSFLEFDFPNDIFSFQFRLSFWKRDDYLLLANSSIFVEFSRGLTDQFQKGFDLMPFSSKITTDRNDMQFLSISFVSGARRIRFRNQTIAVGDRNKGRIAFDHFVFWGRDCNA